MHGKDVFILHFTYGSDYDERVRLSFAMLPGRSASLHCRSCASCFASQRLVCLGGGVGGGAHGISHALPACPMRCQAAAQGAASSHLLCPQGILTYGKQGTGYRFDKRDYSYMWPPLNLTAPPQNVGVPALHRLIACINEASAATPGWADHTHAN